MSLPFARSESIGPPLPENARVEQVVQRVNANIEFLQSWRSSDLRIGGRSLPVHLTGKIAVERPRNFRLTASAMGVSDEADFGSNADWFWFWVKRGQPNHVFRAQHSDMEHSDFLQRAIPFQPDWLIEALGVVPIDPQKVTRLEQGESHQTVNLISELLSPSGQPVQKVIRVDARHGVVLGHSLYDAGGRLIAKADLGKHAVQVLDGEKRVVMPHLVALEWPQAGMQINLEIGQIDVNPTMVPPQFWEVPNKEPYYQSVDIGARTRHRYRRASEASVGRSRIGRSGSSSAIDRNAQASGRQAPSNDDWPAASEQRPSNWNDSGEWNKPIESADAQSDSQNVRTGSTRAGRWPGNDELSQPGPTRVRPATGGTGAGAGAGTAPRDPFNSDDWPNRSASQGPPTGGELIETAPH